MSLDQELARLVYKNVINEVDALDKCQDKQEFYRFLTQMGGSPTGGMSVMQQNAAE